MKSPVVKRSIVIAGHKTSVSLEDAFWNGLKDIARERHMNLSELVAEIDAAATRQSVVGNQAVRAGLLSRARRRRRDQLHGIARVRRATGHVSAVSRIVFRALSAAQAD